MSDKLAEDWLSLWRSELTAMAADRELRETTKALLTLWANTAITSLGAIRTAHDSALRNPVPTQPPRPAPDSAAPLPGLDAFDQLNRRIAELEQRLAAFERSRRTPD